MSIRTGIYDFFAYTVPGIFYLLIAGYAAAVFQVLPFNWSTLDNLSFIVAIILAGAGFVLGLLLDPVAHRWSRLLRRQPASVAAYDDVAKTYPWLAPTFASDDWRLLLRYLKDRSHDEGANVEHLNAICIMLRNISFGLILLAAIHCVYFVAMNAYYWNIAVAAGCGVLSWLAFFVSEKHARWFYSSIYTAAIATNLDGHRWTEISMGQPTTSLCPNENHPTLEESGHV